MPRPTLEPTTTAPERICRERRIGQPWYSWRDSPTVTHREALTFLAKLSVADLVGTAATWPNHSRLDVRDELLASIDHNTPEHALAPVVYRQIVREFCKQSAPTPQSGRRDT